MTAIGTSVCVGANRFGVPCTNRVATPGEVCGKCHGQPAAGTPVGPAPASPRQPRPEPPSILAAPAPDESWTPAAQLRCRLEALAGGNPDLRELVEVSARLVANSKAASTKAAYQQHRATFTSFCAKVGLNPAPPVTAEVVCLFLAFLTLYRRVDRSTGERVEQGQPLSHRYLRQAVAAIGHLHRNDGLPDPTDDPAVVAVLEGYGKTYGTEGDGKDPITLDLLGTICTPLTQPSTIIARDRALILLATDAQLRLNASQLTALTRSTVLQPETTLDPLTLLVTQQGTRALTPVTIERNALPELCAVTAVMTIVASDAGPALFAGPAGPLTREGIIWIVNSVLRRTTIRPAVVDARLPRLLPEDRLAVSLALDAPSDADLRDRAIITSLYWGCFRGEEVAATRFHELRFVEHGVEWQRPKTKNHQRHDAPPRAIPRATDPFVCAVTTLSDWLDRLAALLGRPLEPSDPVFPALNRPGSLDKPMSRAAIHDVVRKLAARAGLTGDYGSHSPRAGFVTDGINQRIPREHLQHYGGWRNAKSLDPYYRRADVWAPDTNPAMTLARVEPPS